MSDLQRTVKQGKTTGKADAIPAPVVSSQLLQVIIALNLVRTNLGMYPSGHVQIMESLDAAYAIIQAELNKKSEWIVGFPGDTVTFGENAPEREKQNNTFKDFARILSRLRIVFFRLRRGLKKDELLEFCRILSAKPADIWTMGKIDSVILGAGIKAIEVAVVDADNFRIWKHRETGENRELPKNDARIRRKLPTLSKQALEGTAVGAEPADGQRMRRSDAVRFRNSGHGDLPSDIVGYEKLFHQYQSQGERRQKTDAKVDETLAGINSRIPDLQPQLKLQPRETIQSQLSIDPDEPLSAEDLTRYPVDLLSEIQHQTNRLGEKLSPSLANLVKRMNGLDEGATHDLGGELSAGDIETLLRREQYEHYVPEEYDSLLTKAAGNASCNDAGADQRLPLKETLKPPTDAEADFQICQLCLVLMDEFGEADYLACSRKLERSLPDLLRAGRFQWLTLLFESLRRQQADSLLRSLTETVARHVALFVHDDKGEQAALKAFIVAGGAAQNLPWLFDLLLDVRTVINETLAEIIRGFGREATEEALRWIPGRDPQSIERLLTIIRDVGEKVDAASLKELLPIEDLNIRREVIKTLVWFDDPATVELLRESLQSRVRDIVLEAVELSCRYRITEMLADLTARIRTVVMREEDAILNEWIVCKVIETGHPAVVPLLEKIASARLTISPKHLARLKKMIYRDLHYLPEEKIGKLLKIGSKSGDREIRMMCAAAVKGKG